jgi:GTP-binding protein EngB required for normal cell division
MQRKEGVSMTEPTSRELYDIINEMRVDIGVMNTKMDFVMDSKKTAEEAQKTADRAMLKSEENAAKIDGIKKTAMWAIGLTITALISLTAIVVSVAF